MAITPGKVQVTVPIYTRTGEPLSAEQVQEAGLIHLGDATIEVPIEFSAQPTLPFEEGEPPC